MRAAIILLDLVVLATSLAANSPSSLLPAHAAAMSFQTSASYEQSVGALRPNSLCAMDEQIIFSCAVRRPAKIVSLCASGDLTKEHGYLQYRFGLPAKIELEFPKARQGTQHQFRYSHYFRFQVDLTEIKFAIDGYEYSIFDDYNGEEKPVRAEQGVSVTALGKQKDVRFVCRGKAKADYGILPDVLATDEDQSH